MKRDLKSVVLIVSIISIIYILVKMIRKMGWGVVNKNPFNIRPGDNWLGSVGQSGGFVKFIDFKYGLRAGLLNLWNGYFSKGYTIRKLISVYAPGSDNNDEQAYVNAISRVTGLDPDQVPGRKSYLSIAAAIVFHENGVKLYNEEDLKNVALEFGFNQYL